MAYDVQVLAQSLLYFIIFIFGFPVAVPLGVTVIEFENHCVLYTDVTWTNSTFFTYELSQPNLCNFSVFGAVFTCIIYSLGMGIYHAYAALSSKDPNIGYQMWIMPFVLLNTLITIYMLISSSIVSIGLSYLCEKITNGAKVGAKIDSCSDILKWNWNEYSNTDYDPNHFYSYPKVTEVASWITFLLWGIQLGLCILRSIRVRRLRLRDMDHQPTMAGSSKNPPEDLENFASANPSA